MICLDTNCLIRSLVPGSVEAGRLVIGEVQAAESARLFNAVGCNRRLRVDAMIAGTAIVLGAPLAMDNQSDFSRFVEHRWQYTRVIDRDSARYRLEPASTSQSRLAPERMFCNVPPNANP